MTQEMLMGTIRTVMAAVGGYLFQRGIVDNEMWLSVTSAVLALAALGWSYYAKRKSAVLMQAANTEGVSSVVMNKQTDADAVPDSKVVGPVDVARIAATAPRSR